MRPSLRTATGEGRRRNRALVAALTPLFAVFILMQPASVLAKPPTGTVTVIDGVTGVQTVVNGEPEVCTFAVTFDFDNAFPIVGWKIKDWVPGNWKDGKTRLKGQGATDADGGMRIPDSGFFTLAEGRYNVVADDEWPIDGSSKVQSFHVVCPDAAEPTEPTEPTPPDDGEEQPVTGTPTIAPPGDDGEVLPATGRPRATLPPTDAGRILGMTTDDTLVVLLCLGTVVFIVMSITPNRRGLGRRR
jgi:hypothetical protein